MPARSSLVERLGEPPTQLLDLPDLEGSDTQLGDESLTQLVAQSWFIAVGGEIRAGYFSVPGYRRRQRVSVPPGAELRFAFARAYEGSDEVLHRVLVAEGDREEVVFEQSSGAASDPGWQDERISLAPFAGRKIELVFETLGHGEKQREAASGLWSIPQLWSDRERRDASKRPNVVLISVDTLRADRMSLYGNPRPTTPTIDRWASERGVVFEHAVAAAPWTLPSHVSLLTGLDCLSHGANFGDRVSPNLDLLAEKLAREGYETLAIIGGGYLQPRFGFLQGFDRYLASDPAAKPLPFDVQVEAARELLAGRTDSGPYFLFLHTYATHDPYRPREPYYSAFGGTDPMVVKVVNRPWTTDAGRRLLRFHARESTGEELRGDGALENILRLYDSGVAWTDHLLGRVFEAIDPANTVVVLTSDHGEALGAAGNAGHSHFFDDTTLVPLVLALPDGRAAGRRIPEQVRSIDIVPTLLEVLGLEAASGTRPTSELDGASLLAMLDEKSAPREAWTYNGVGQYGLALRLQDGTLYTLQDSPWARASRREQLYASGRAGLEPLAPEEHSGLRSRLRRRAIGRFARGLKGLEIELANTTHWHWRLRIDLRGTETNRIKTPDPGTLLTQNGTTFGLHLAPGTRQRLVLSEPTSPDFLLAVEDRGGRYELTLPLETLHTWLPIRFRDGLQPERTRRRGNLPPGRFILLRWTGEDEEASPSPLEDEGVLEHLRALGYL